MFIKLSKNYIFVFSMCCNLLLIKFIVCDSSVLEVAAINEQQRQEIQHLKSELSKDLDTNQANVAGKDGAIVQPFWTQDTNKSVHIESAKVEVNAQNRHEAADLRAEIEQAVTRGSYATDGAPKMQDIKALEDFFKTKVKGKEALLTMTGEQSIPAAPENEYVGASSVGKEDLHSANIISANVVQESEIDIRKLQRLELSKRRTRELLVLKYIEEDFSFEFGDEVNEWKHIMHAGQEYFIGRRVTDLLIVRKQNVKYEQAMVMEVGHVINCMETYTYWNFEQQQQEGVILIGAEDKVLWYRANPEMKQIELYWNWMVGNTITGLTYFTLDSNDYLTISGNQTLNIYQFKLETKELWIAQSLQLKFPFQEVTVLDSGRDVILAIPQNNTAEIYTYNPHEADISHIRFQLKKSIDAEGILTIAGFKMGGHSYLAITGYQPQILLYKQGDFVTITILGNNFGLVELFFPLPLRTYRDDLILLVQHRLDFSTHVLTVVETLIWDGEAFETSIPVPCYLGSHVVYGVGCMLDLQRNEGLKGATLLKSGDDVSVLVPRYKAESGLFHFRTELLEKNSELLDLQEMFDFLKNWVKEQDDLLAEAETFLKISNEELMKLKPDLSNIESLKTPKFVYEGEVGEIYVNDYKWTLEDSNVDLELLIQNMEDLENLLNSGRQRRNLDDASYEELDLDEVLVDELEVQKVNGEIFFIQNGELNFKGNVIVSELEVLEKLAVLQKRQVVEEDLILETDLEFDKINGVDWSDIKDNVVFRDRKLNLEELEVKGEVFVEHLLTINTLNTMNFPDDFMLSNSPAASIVNAEKNFVSTLQANAVDIKGNINGNSPDAAITLKDAQEWKGMITFKNLEVLELHGKGHAHDGHAVPHNPTLQEQNIIEANCHFSELIVNGPIVLRGHIDEQPLSSRIGDIILNPADTATEILIPSKKSFDLIQFPIDFHIENHKINEIPVQDFVTVHTKQTLNVTSLEGLVYFYNLTLMGSYDGVNIENLLEEIIMLDKPIDLSTTELIFQQELTASHISILETVNNESIIGNLQTLQEDLTVDTAEFESLQTLQADFFDDILGSGKLNNIELHSLVNGRSWHELAIRGNIFLNELILEKGIQTDELHGIRAEYLLDFLQQIDELPDMVLNGQIQVDHITVTGDIQLHELNGLLFEEELQLTTIKLDRPNFLSTELRFKNLLDIKGQLNVVGHFRGNYLPDVIDDIIIRAANSCIDIKAPKSFLKPVEVLQNTQLKALNGMPMENMAWKSKRNNFSGSVHLKGNLMVRDIHLQGAINNFKWQDLLDLLYFDEKFQNFVLKNIIQFNSPLLLEDLTVMGDLNDVMNLTNFFENLVYKNHLILLKGKKTFTGRVTIDQGAHINNLNGQDLTYLFKNLVYIHGLQPVMIQSPVKFAHSVRANAMAVKKSLTIESVSGCSISDWLNNSLRVDQDQNISHSLHFAAGSLDRNSLSVNFINDKDLSRVITLNTEQTFNETVKFSNVVLEGFISPKGRINNLDLEEEFNNTLMTFGHQHISTPLNIQTVIVSGNLDVFGPVNNNKDLQDVATLHENLIFKSSIYFQSLYSPQVFAIDLVNGIDFDKWFESAVQNHHPNNQYITGKWSTKRLTVTTEAKDFEPWQYYSYMRFARNDNTDLYKDKEICMLIKKIWRALAEKPVFVKYVEVFNMDFDKHLKNMNETFKNVFYLKSKQEIFLLINFECNSSIYKWLAGESKFVFQNAFLSGPIDELFVIPAFSNTTTLQFITSSAATREVKCSFHLKNINKWKLENDSIVLGDDFPDTSDIHIKFQGSNSSLWTLNNETIQELDLDYKVKQKWQLPVEQNQSRYRFVPLADEQQILLTNEQKMIVLSKPLKSNKSKKSSFNYEKPQILQTKDKNSQSLLNPNSSLTQSFIFADFKQVLERILVDLGQRLNQQINITQLSIPESDLFDEHLVPDFLAIMEELRNQNIYPPELFNISVDKIMLPQNPSQVLAARVVQISWPVALEIEKIHAYLRSNENHDHPLCANITKSLGFLMKDVLMLANENNNSKEAKDWTLALSTVIECIRAFEKDLEKFVKVVEIYSDDDHEINDLDQFGITRELKIFSQKQNDLIVVENSYLPGLRQGEILSLVVGSISSPRRLWAVTNRKISLDANSIYVYLQGLEGQLYQVISAIQPRSLQQLRLKQETLLLFVQECCQVQILKYHGSQGFTTFAEIIIAEHIKQILTVSMPASEGNSKHFLILLLEKNIKFYEFVIEGYDTAPASTLIPLDCL